MRKAIFGLMALIAATACFVPFAAAQNLGEVGAFGEYLRVGQTGSDFGGLGGRVAINPNRYIGLEAEMSYDFTQIFSETYTGPGMGGGTVDIVNSNFSILNGLFGPTLSTGHGPVRLFLTAKGGFINFRFNPTPASFGSFTSSVTSLRTNNVEGAFYPGGGIEAHIGPIGLRLDIGDEMYFSDGTHHDLRVTFGPTIRF